MGARSRRPVDVIGGWLSAAEGPVILAIDAPLGWPVALGATLAGHSAGEGIDVPANEMFRRTSDRFIKTTFGKTPLDVGADRIARTAHSALELLEDIRRRTGLPVPLAWSPGELAPVSAIEVYPAATLLACGWRSDGYKDKDESNVAARRDIIAALGTVVDLPTDVSLLERSADALDAAVCVLAGKDFLESRALPPLDQDLARREGWIWVRAR